MGRTSLLKQSVVAVAAVLTFVACGDRDRSDTRSASASTGAPPANTAAPPTAAPAPSADTGNTGAATSATASSSAASVAAPDRNFLGAAASSGLLEVDASRLALERSKNQQIRAFAQRMVGDHAKANDSLKAIANSAGVTDLPTTMSPVHSGNLERLRGLSGPSFDREYAAQIGVAAHMEAVALFEKGSQDASSQDLKAFAEKTLPTLRDHLKQSQALAKAVGVPAERMKAASAPPDLNGSGAPAPGKSASSSGMATPADTPSGGSSGGSTTGATGGSPGAGTGSGTGTNPVGSSTGK